MLENSIGPVPLQAYLIVAAFLFCTGVWGLINSRNAVRVLMSIELMLNAVNINLMSFSSYIDGSIIRGQVFSIFVITVAAAEAAVGLAILLSLYRNRVTIDMENFNLLNKNVREFYWASPPSGLSYSCCISFLYRCLGINK